MATRYDRLGRSYTRTRRADPRVEAQIHAALGNSRTVVNVGAGTGSYEPRDRLVVAAEPSSTMLRQRPAASAPAVQAFAERLPFRDGAFDGALAIFTIHHWHDVGAGLAELRRVSRRQVVLTFDPAFDQMFWMVTDYLPEWADVGDPAPGIDGVAAHLDVRAVEVVPVPADCQDGFGGAYWSRPERYLDPEVCAGISGLARLDRAVLERGLSRLRADLDSGAWDARHGHLRTLGQIDLGYRLIIAG